jgi:acetyltransferase-like isoleucine patch superfamily enzyme
VSLKRFIKNLLPHFIVKRYSAAKSGELNYSKYLTSGNSILLPNFNISVTNPQKRIYVTVGNDTMLDCQIYFESGNGKVDIGNRVYIGGSTIICRSKIEFGNNIFVAWGAYFYDHDSHSLDYQDRQRDITQQLIDYRKGESFIKNKNWDVVKNTPITICDNAWIGMNAIILKGVTIGEGAIVGAGSVVTKSVPAWTLVAGNPARVIKELNK